MKDAGDKLPADVKAAITEKLDELKKVKEGEDKDAIAHAHEALSVELQKIGQAFYNKDASAENNKESENGTEPESR